MLLMQRIMTLGTMIALTTSPISGHSGLARSRARVSADASVGREECSIDSLGSAVASDTTKMQRRTMALPLGEATEGGEATIYYRRGRPRVVVVVYAGEMGQESRRYFLASPTNYVVERELIRYEVPITVQSVPRIISRLPAVLYVCGGQMHEALDSADVRDIRGALDSALVRFRRAK